MDLPFRDRVGKTNLPHRSELIPPFVSRKAVNGSNLPLGHFWRYLFTLFMADCVHQCLPTKTADDRTSVAQRQYRTEWIAPFTICTDESEKGNKPYESGLLSMRHWHLTKDQWKPMIELTSRAYLISLLLSANFETIPSAVSPGCLEPHNDWFPTAQVVGR